MKLNASTGRKLKYGGTSLAICVLVLAIVIITNLIFSLCTQRFTWYIDLTPEPHFTISDECYELIGGAGENTPIKMVDKFRAENKAYNQANGLSKGMDGYRDENVKINILFCVERDVLLNEDTTEYILRNAEELAAKYPDHITVESDKDIVLNRPRFTKYQSSNTEVIERESVIIECGSEYRIRSLRSFYMFDEESNPVAYNGEKTFASSILAVTRAENPLACYTVNHGESFPDSTTDESGKLDAPFLRALEDAGYRTQALDLSKEQIPEACRLLVVFDPKQDFLDGKSDLTAQGELDKLDDFLANKKSLMVFMNPSDYDGAKGLENLEEFLGEWGLAFRRHEGSPYTVKDEANSILGNSSAVIADYPENELATAWTTSMTSGASNPKVVFPNATALTYSSSYPLGYNSSYQRQVYDLFVSSESAKASAADEEIAAATKTDPFKLMCVSTKQFTEQEATNALSDFSYVALCGSTEFASEEYLESNAYGNSDLLLSVFQTIGREPVAVGLKYKQFANYEIQTITAEDATQYMIVLTLVPVLISLCAGVFVIVRRKNR